MNVESTITEAKRRSRSRRGQGELLREEILSAAEQLFIRAEDRWNGSATADGPTWTTASVTRSTTGS
jgi:hypothetical protein